jgi:hypothetical protein
LLFVFDKNYYQKHNSYLFSKVVSDLASQAFTREAAGATRNGLPVFSIRPGDGIVTLEQINRQRDGTLQLLVSCPALSPAAGT